MKKNNSTIIIFSLSILLALFFIGCSTEIDGNKCGTKLFSREGKCCENLCDLECPNGYVEGSCNCECLTLGDGKEGNDDNSGIDDLFDDNDDVSPPPIPS